MCTFDHLVALCFGECSLSTRVSTHFSDVHSVVIVCAGQMCLLFKLLLNFRNVFKHSESRSYFACN